MPATRGGLTEAVKPGNIDSATLVIPAASIPLEASPTDRQQNGQTGTSSARSTPSVFMLSMMRGRLRSSISWGFSKKPMME